mgnify:FL=1
MYLEDEISEEEYVNKRDKVNNEISNIENSLDKLTQLLYHEEMQKNTNKQISQLINEGKAEGFNKELFDLLVDKIIIGGKRYADGVDDPTVMKFDLNDYNLNTHMSCDIVEGCRHYNYQGGTIDTKKKVDNETCSSYSNDTCGDSCSSVPTKTE